MARSLFDFKDYRQYLSEALPVSGPKRGSRVRLAEALGCKGGFISLVINGGAHFSPEYAFKTNLFLEHDSDESDFFQLLVSYGRAGLPDLEKYYLGKIQEILARRTEVKERIRAKEGLGLLEQTTYYSSWHYAAIHMALYVLTLQTKPALARHFRLSQAKVSEVLSFLVVAGLAEQKGDHFKAFPNRIHLPSNSPLIGRHHSNWRTKAGQSLDEPQEGDLHYSLVMSAYPAAVEKIREILLNAIQSTEPILRECKDEAGYVMALDLFQLR